MIHIRLLGPIEIDQDGEALKVDSRKALALLGYLAATRRAVPRTALLGLLWPDMAEERGRANLSWTLNRLSALLPGLIHADRANVRFTANTDVALDLDAFEQGYAANQEAALAGAIALYRGPLLDGLHLSGCADFEHWLVIERHRYEQRAIELFERYASALIARSALSEASDVLGRLLAIDPLRENASRQRMQVLAQTGQRSAALALYEHLRALLAEDMGAEPDASTVALAEQIRRGELPQAAPAFPAKPASPALIGREAELAELARLFADPAVRLLTIVGFGGIGKTWLASAYAQQAAPEYRDGAPVVALAGLETREQLVAALGETLFAQPELPEPALRAALAGRQHLLVLDNFEQLLPHAALLAELLAAAPGLRILATSQQRLALRGEWVFDLRGLSLPQGNDLAAALRSDAVELFVRHAQRVHAAFRLDASNVGAVARICRALAGHPLAIEGAASWVRSLSCQEIAAALRSDTALLTSSATDLPARHRSAQAIFEYSWQRLEKQERQAFTQLSVFPADFSLAEGQAVLAPELAEHARTLLAALVDKSLLIRQKGGRYKLHGLLRAFAASKLAPADAEAAQARHWAFFGGLLCEQVAALRGADVPGASAQIERELLNIRAGWMWVLAVPDPLAFCALDALLLFYDNHGWFQAGADLFAETEERLGAEAAQQRLRGPVQARHGFLLLWLGQYGVARSLLEQALAAAQASANRAEQSLALAGLSFAKRWLGEQAEAAANATQALELARALDDEWLIANALQFLALIRRDQGAVAEARRAAQECRVLFTTFGYRRGIGFALTVLALIAQDQGDLAEAERLFQRGRAFSAETGDPLGPAISEQYLGQLALQQGRRGEARQRLERALAESQTLGYQWGVVRARIQLGELARLEGNPGLAEDDLTEALAEARAIGAQPLIDEALAVLRSLLA